MKKFDFLRSLEPRTRRSCFLAAAMYLGGALGMEALGGLWLSTGHTQRGVYMALATGEETLEMLGAGYFLIVMLRHLVSTSAVRQSERLLESAA